MPIQTDISVSPYFDDFDSTKNYQQVLFKPAVAIQTRELNTLQSILQSQIEKFGDNIFTKGTIVSGCNFQYYDAYPYVKLVDLQVDGQTAVVNSYVGLYATSDTSSLKAYILASNSGFLSQAPDLNTVFVRYINSGNDNARTAFANGEVLTLTDKLNSIFKVNVPVGGVAAGISNTDSLVFSSALSITGNTVAFTSGNNIVDPATGARAEIVEVNSTAIANTLVVKVRPFANDMSNASLTTSNNWTFYSGNSVNIQLANGTLTTAATISSVYGSGAAAFPVTTATGVIESVLMTAQGNGYIIAPYTTVKTANSSATITDIIANTSLLTAQNFKAKITVATSNQASSSNSSVLDYNTSPTGFGYAFGISSGIVYQKGYFLDVAPQTVVVRKYANTPSDVSVGFDTSETIINSNIDASLLDNATGTFNSLAPGADRLKLTPFLVVVNTASSAGNTLFFPVTTFKNGFPYLQNQQTNYSKINDMIAQRTLETSGDFVLDPFDVTFKSATANTSSNTGASNQANVFSLIVDPGQAYISGYRVKTYTNFSANVNQGTDTGSSTVTINTNYGNYINIKEIGGVFNFTTGDYVTLYDTAKEYCSNNSYYSTGNTSPSGNSIGTARIRSLVPVPNSGTPGSPTYSNRLYVFDVNMNAGFNFGNAKSVYSNTVSSGGIADIIVSNTSYHANGSVATTTAVIQNAATSTLLFAGGAVATKNTANSTYTAGGVFSGNNGVSINTTSGVITLTTSGSNTFPYTANASLTDDQLLDLSFTFHSCNVQSNTSPITTTTSAASNVVVVSSTSSLIAGQYLKITAAAAGDTIRRITNIINSTAVRVDSAIATANSARDAFIFYPQNGLITLASNSANLNSTGTVLKINLGAAINSVATPNATIITPVLATNKTVTNKDSKRDTTVAINFSNAAGISFTGQLNTNTLVTTVSSTSGLIVGQQVSANITGIPANTTIASVVNSSAITLSSAATASGNSTINIANTVGPWALGHPDIFRLKRVYTAVNTAILANSTHVAAANVANTSTIPATWTDVTNDFYVDHRQNPEFYDTSVLYKKNDSKLILSTGDALLVQFDHFTGSGGAFHTKSSYIVDDTQPYNFVSNTGSTVVNTLEIPEMFDARGNYYDLIDCVDFRPRVANTAAITLANAQLSTINPPAHTNAISKFVLTDNQFPIDGKQYTSSLNYYKARADRIVIDKFATIKVIKGVPGISEITAPKTPDDNLSLNVVIIPPYPSIPKQKDLNYTLITDTKTASVQRKTTTRLNSHIISIPKNANTEISVIQPSGYTMEQIATLENRIKALEYGAQLTQLERSISSLSIPSSINGAINRYKFGYFADGFVSDQFSDLANPEYLASRVNNEIIPPVKTLNIEFKPNTADANTVAATVGTAIMLPYVETTLISQAIATTGLTPPNEPNLVTTFCDGFTKYGTYSRSDGTTFNEIIQVNSYECGYRDPPINYNGTLTSSPESFTLISFSNGEIMNELPTSTNIVNFIPV